MDIQAMRTMMEIQALQSMDSTSNSSVLSNGSSIFSELIEGMLEDASSSLNEAYNKLGSGMNATTATTTPNGDYLANLLYQGANAPQLHKEPTKTIDNYVSTDYTGQQAYENVLQGAEQYAALIQKAAKQYDVPEKLIASVMKQESNFNSTALSHAGATGLMQLMPATAKYLGVQDATDPEQNIMGGAKYLRQMLDQFDNNISVALAAYNAGPGNVRKYDGIPPFKETTNYVKKVMNYYQG
ncbi:MAG: lytic transglycosylase domain-containing protein [Solibacillus sp.]